MVKKASIITGTVNKIIANSNYFVITIFKYYFIHEVFI